MKIAVALLSALITSSSISAMNKQQGNSGSPQHNERFDSDNLDSARLGKPNDNQPNNAGTDNSGSARITNDQNKPETPARQQEVPGAGKCGLFRIIDDQN